MKNNKALRGALLTLLGGVRIGVLRAGRARKPEQRNEQHKGREENNGFLHGIDFLSMFFLSCIHE